MPMDQDAGAGHEARLARMLEDLLALDAIGLGGAGRLPAPGPVEWIARMPDSRT